MTPKYLVTDNGMYIVILLRRRSTLTQNTCDSKKNTCDSKKKILVIQIVSNNFFIDELLKNVLFILLVNFSQ